MRRVARPILLPLLAAAAAGTIAGSLLIGPTPWREVDAIILWELRLPRALLSFLVGALLGGSGVLFQALFRNPLADPFVVGVSGGAGVGAVGSTVAGVSLTIWGLTASTLFAFLGAVGAAFLAYALARIRGRVPTGSLLLAGFAIGAFSGALVSILLLADSRNWHEVITWLMGNLNHADPWNRLKIVAPIAVVSFGAMMVYARDLNLLLLGEEEARHLGIEVERTKAVLLSIGAVAAAGAVATCGIIGFVGLIVPHVVRGVTGPDHRRLLPATILAGGSLLTAADLAARSVSPETMLPIGAVTALLGAPFFLYLLRRRAVRV